MGGWVNEQEDVPWRRRGRRGGRAPGPRTRAGPSRAQIACCLLEWVGGWVGGWVIEEEEWREETQVGGWVGGWNGTYPSPGSAPRCGCSGACLGSPIERKRVGGWVDGWVSKPLMHSRPFFSPIISSPPTHPPTYPVVRKGDKDLRGADVDVTIHQVIPQGDFWVAFLLEQVQAHRHAAWEKVGRWVGGWMSEEESGWVDGERD